MDEQARKENAARLIEHIRGNVNGAHDAWKKLDMSDPQQRRTYVKNALGLEHEPTDEDIQAMHDHAGQHLQPQVEAMRKERPDSPVMGFFCLATEK